MQGAGKTSRGRTSACRRKTKGFPGEHTRCELVVLFFFFLILHEKVLIKSPTHTLHFALINNLHMDIWDVQSPVLNVGAMASLTHVDIFVQFYVEVFDDFFAEFFVEFFSRVFCRVFFCRVFCRRFLSTFCRQKTQQKT